MPCRSASPGPPPTSSGASETDARGYLGFVAAVGSLIVLYFVSGSPISLYSMWEQELGLTHSQLSMVSMWYLFGTVIPLLFLPRISDHLGRRPATVMILCVSLCGAITFANITSPETIMMGRFIQGIASGLGSSTVAAYVVDLSVEMPKWVGPMITSSAPTLGLSTGAFVSGGVVTFTSMSPDTYFGIAAVLIVAFIVLILFARETMPRSPGLIRSLVPKFGLPDGCGRLFAACSMVFVGTWALGGFSQSFSAVITEDYGPGSNAFLSAAVFTALLLPNAFGSFFAKRFDVRTAQRWGFGLFAFCAAMMFVSLAVFGNLLMFCAFSIVAGFVQGIAFTAGVTELLSRATREQRAGTFSTIYLTSYGGAAIPNLVVGLVPGEHSVESILTGYVVLIVAMFVILLVLSARPYQRQSYAGD